MNFYNTIGARPYAQNINKNEETLLSLKNVPTILKPIGEKIYGLTNQADESIPQWDHPFYSAKGDCIFIDIRPFQNRYGEIVKEHDYQAFLSRAALEQLWVKERPEFESIAGDLSVVFATWMGNLFRSRFSVSEADVAKIKVVAASYYLLLHFDNEAISSMDIGMRESLAAKLALRTLRIPTQLVEMVTESTEFKMLLDMPSLAGLVVTINSVIDTPLGGLDHNGLILQSVNGTWMGRGDKILSAAMLEHPPTLAWMIERFDSLGIYRRTGMGSAIDSAKRTAGIGTVARFVKET